MHFWFVRVIIEYRKFVLLLVDILPIFTCVKLRKLLIFFCHKAVLDSQTSQILRAASCQMSISAYKYFCRYLLQLDAFDSYITFKSRSVLSNFQGNIWRSILIVNVSTDSPSVYPPLKLKLFGSWNRCFTEYLQHACVSGKGRNFNDDTYVDYTATSCCHFLVLFLSLTSDLHSCLTHTQLETWLYYITIVTFIVYSSGDENCVNPGVSIIIAQSQMSFRSQLIVICLDAMVMSLKPQPE